MSKIKNQRIWSDDQNFLKNLAEEHDKYLGRQYSLDLEKGLLVIFALPQKKKKRDKEKEPRNKRVEKHA